MEKYTKAFKKRRVIKPIYFTIMFLKGYFIGSPAKLVSYFVSDNNITIQEMEELLRRIKSFKNLANE